LAAEIEDDYAAEFGVGALVVLLHLRSDGHCPPLVRVARAYGSKAAASRRTP
jgi:hypothetical protein